MSAASEGRPVSSADRRRVRTETGAGAGAVVGAEVAPGAGAVPGTGAVAASITSSIAALGSTAVTFRPRAARARVSLPVPAPRAKIGRAPGRERRHRGGARAGE